MPICYSPLKVANKNIKLGKVVPCFLVWYMLVFELRQYEMYCDPGIVLCLRLRQQPFVPHWYSNKYASVLYSIYSKRKTRFQNMTIQTSGSQTFAG